MGAGFGQCHPEGDCLSALMMPAGIKANAQNDTVDRR